MNNVRSNVTGKNEKEKTKDRLRKKYSWKDQFLQKYNNLNGEKKTEVPGNWLKLSQSSSYVQ